MLIVASLGGNAVSPPGKEGNIPQQYATTRVAMKPLADLIVAGHQLVITHGNGPQAGVLLRRVEIAAQHNIYPLPLGYDRGRHAGRHGVHDFAVPDERVGLSRHAAGLLHGDHDRARG